ncbi:MAG: protein-export chaperone SecB [Alphaproteobacteria bacterium]|jgi:preprotein translocase subunit SecB|nr:protein-export chaperone SecB [Alphaproteobacteria bacterium]
MADNDIPMENGANGAGENSEMEGVPFMIGAQYIKDFSFENPRGVETLSAINENPDVSVDVSTNARAIGEEGMFEVLLFIRAEATVDDSPVFIVELTYGGVVQVGSIPEEEIKPVVLIEGPRHLFPFARSIVSNAVRDGGFPPLLINPIDFGTLYVEQHVDSDGSDI